jgi:hypothetical protein
MRYKRIMLAAICAAALSASLGLMGLAPAAAAAARGKDTAVKIRIGIGIAAIATLAALAIPATAALAGSIQTSTIMSFFDATPLLDHGQGHAVTMGSSFSQSTYYPIEDANSKWYEIQDTAGGNQCLDLYGSGSGGVYYVNTEACNFRSAELWWFPAGLGNNSDAEIINQYGTKLLSHDACLFNNASGQDPKVEDCQANPKYNYQYWTTNF